MPDRVLCWAPYSFSPNSHNNSDEVGDFFCPFDRWVAWSSRTWTPVLIKLPSGRSRIRTHVFCTPLLPVLVSWWQVSLEYYSFTSLGEVIRDPERFWAGDPFHQAKFLPRPIRIFIMPPNRHTNTHSIAHRFTQFQWEIHTEWNEAACWRALTSCLPLKKPVRNHEFTEEIKVCVIDSLPAEVAFFLDCPPLSLFFINVRIDFISSRIKEKIKIPPSCSPWGTTLSTLIFETFFYADSNTCLYLLHFSCNGKGLNYIYCSALVFFNLTMCHYSLMRILPHSF